MALGDMATRNKCDATPIISPKSKAQWLQHLMDTFGQKNRIIDFCSPMQKYQQDHLWLLPNGKLIKTLDYHAEVERPLYPLYDQIEQENPHYTKVEGYWVSNTVLDMIRINQTATSTHVDLAIDTPVTPEQWRTLKQCVEMSEDHRVVVDISHPKPDTLWHDETMQFLSESFDHRGYSGMYRFITDTQQKKNNFC